MPRNAPAVLVTMDILEQLQLRSGEPVGVSELARAIGATKATCFTVLRMLLSRGYVTQDPITRQYSAGPALLGLGMALGRGLDPMDLARLHLAPLCHELGVGGAFSRHVGNGAVQMLGRVDTSLPPLVTVPTRELIPFPSMSIHAFLAWEAPAEVERIYRAWRPTDDAPPFLASLEAYLAELAAIRAQGYSEGVLRAPIPEILISVTVATVFDGNGRPVLAMTLSTPTSAHEPVHRHYGQPLRAVAEDVTRAIGGRPPAGYRMGERPALVATPSV